MMLTKVNGPSSPLLLSRCQGVCCINIALTTMAAKKKVGGKSCWKGYSAQGTKKGKNGKRVNNCVKNGKK